MANDLLALIALGRKIGCDPSECARLLELQRSSVWVPEKVLLLAILNYAFYELSSSVNYTRREAADWIMLDNDHIFGFVSVCEALEISPSRLRKSLASLLEPALRLKRRPGPIAISAPIPHDENASHEYVGSQHCRECRDRYHRWYKQNGPVKRGRAA